ncbi:MAG: SCP2 sterol-binding domain-containing protein [Gammaproteobacteria bacterium]
MPVQRLLQAAFDFWIKDTPEVRVDCAALAGRCIAVELTDLDTELCLRPHEAGIAVTLAMSDDPDVRIAATSGDLLRMIRGTQTPPPRLVITGDAELAQSVRALFRRVRFDPDERLAALIGDVPAHQLGRALRGIAAFGRESLNTLAGMTGEYLQYEARTLPTKAEVANFVDAVDEVRDGVERAAARFESIVLEQRAAQ